MLLLSELKREIVDSFLSRANEALSFVQGYIANGDYYTAVSRSYYAALFKSGREVLPALPDEWNEGGIKGLRARTNAQADIEWNTETATVTVTSDRAQTITISVHGGEEKTVSFNQGETKTVTLARSNFFS